MLKVIESVSLANPNRANEDCIFITPRLVGVMDGATGLSGDLISNKFSDAAWFVSRLSEEIQEIFLAGHSLNDAVKQALESVEKEFRTFLSSRNLEKFQYPSAGAIFAAVEKAGLRIQKYGDCEIFYTLECGRIEKFTDSKLVDFDNQAIRQMQFFMSEGIGHAVAREKIRDLLRSNRSKMNTYGGYSALSIGTECLNYLTERIIDPDRCVNLLMCSDGFSAALKDYNICDLEDIFSKTASLKEIAKSIRAIEKEDASLSRYPRLKMHDDISAVLLEPHSSEVS